jgi:hypothetical protein
LASNRSLSRIFHEEGGGIIKNPIRFRLLTKNQDKFHHDKVYQEENDITSLSETHC